MSDDNKDAQANLPPITEQPKEYEIKTTTGQIYKGKTQEEAIAALVHAQEEATRTIAEQRALLESEPSPEPGPTTDQGFDQKAYFALLATDPLAAFSYQMGHALGISPDDVIPTLRRVYDVSERAGQSMEISAFHLRHPEFPGGTEAADLMFSELERDGRALTVENLETVYYRLRDGKKITAIETVPAAGEPMNAPSLTTSPAHGSRDLVSDFSQLTTPEMEKYLKKVGAI